MIIHLLKASLDEFQRTLESGSPEAALRSFTVIHECLESERSSQDRDTRLEQARVIREHEAFSQLLKCPMTKHSFEKPRGYPGDAELLDWIYFPDAKIAEMSDPVGRRIYDYNVRRTAPTAVRLRAKHIAQIIDEVPDGGSMMALACGHFRESRFSEAIQNGRLGRIHLVDQDPRSLDVVRDSGIPHTTFEEANVMRYPRAAEDSPKFDLVYAAGLFDYFSPRMAERVARRMWTHVASGGVLCIPNFNRGIPDVAYLECFMDWWLIYRDHAEMLQIAAGLPAESVESTQCELRDSENIWYLQARRKASVPAPSQTHLKPSLRVDVGGDSPSPNQANRTTAVVGTQSH